MVKVFIIFYSSYGHIKTVAEEIAKGVRESGAEVEVYRVPETLPEEVAGKMHFAKFEDIPVITPEKLTEADGFLFGFPTRYGGQAAQMKAFWDSTGQLWMKQALAGKFGGIFTSTATQHGGQETTLQNFLSHYAHHGIMYVPLGYAHPALNDIAEVNGGSPWGAGVIAGGDGSRQPSAKELAIAHTQGSNFGKVVVKYNK